MKELIRTNDPVKISWLTAVLAECGIDAIVLDTHMSILEGQIGVIPRRIMVIDEDFEAARALVNSAERADDETETVDALLDGRVLLRQPKEGYRVAIDPVLLAASIEAGAGERVLDVGAGVGAAALCLASRCECAELYGLELQPELVELARSNAAESGLKVDFHQGDLLDPPAPIAAGGFTHVMANPPYLPLERADPRTGPAKAKSHIEGDARLSHWIDFMLGMASPNGTVTMIHRADRLDEILASLHGRAGEIVVFPIWPRPEVSPKRVIVRAKVGSGAPLRISPGIVLHEANGRYTKMASDVLHNASPLAI
ncbi:MAG: DUF2007 domain-containing protein [Pseudomonadota bacterium]|nr:DUF2007 domain-containing protein [Pseudomonadota bacterium]